MAMTKETISIYMGLCSQDCAMVYVPETRSFKVIAFPGVNDHSEDPTL